MEKTNNITESRKNHHLNREERNFLEVRYNIDGWSIYRIAKELGRAYNTIKAEIARGTVADKNGKNVRYKSDRGEEVYHDNRKACTRTYRAGDTMPFLHYVEDKFFDKNTRWSLDACVGEALRSGAFRREEIVCTKTLYNYVELGILRIQNIDLPEKLSRSTKAKKVSENKKKLGRSMKAQSFSTGNGNNLIPFPVQAP